MNNLTIEEQIALKKREVALMTTEEIKAELVNSYREMLMIDNQRKQEIGRKWGILPKEEVA